MTIVHYTNSLSAHQLPLDYELVKIVGAENFRYIYTNERLQGGAQEVACREDWVWKQSSVECGELVDEITKWLEKCDLLIVGGIRPIELMERRLAAGKATFYMSERWFKPIQLYFGHCEIRMPGWLRLFHPRYFMMARRFVALFRSPFYRFLPIGPWSAHDMRLLMRVMRLFSRGGCVDGVEFMKWGDFVKPSDNGHSDSAEHEDEIKVLWVGRLLKLKHVETIIRAVVWANQAMVEGEGEQRTFYSLTIVGDGPEKSYLQNLAATLSCSTPLHGSKTPFCPTHSPWLQFLPPVSLPDVRAVMRQHDLYIFSSNGFDGWGAVVPEALSEGMTVIGTYEAGASAALLPESNLFHSGDWRALAKLLINCSYKHTELPYDYTPEGGAKRLIKEYNEL